MQHVLSKKKKDLKKKNYFSVKKKKFKKKKFKKKKFKKKNSKKKISVYKINHTPKNAIAREENVLYELARKKISDNNKEEGVFILNKLIAMNSYSPKFFNERACLYNCITNFILFIFIINFFLMLFILFINLFIICFYLFIFIYFIY